MIKKIKAWLLGHKVASVIIGLVVLLVIYRLVNGTGTAATTRYVLGTVNRGTITETVTGTGQISASNQVDLKSKVSNSLIYLNATVGQTVSKGELIAEIDPGTAGYELANQKLAYEKLVTVDHPDALRQAEDNLTQASTTLANDYGAARADLAAASTALNDVLTGLNSLLSGYLSRTNHQNSSEQGKNYLQQTETLYFSALGQNNAWLKHWRQTAGHLSSEETATIVAEANQAANLVSQAIIAAQEAVTYFKNTDGTNLAQATSAYSTVTGLVSQANAQVSTLAAIQKTLLSSGQALVDAQTSLANLQTGTQELDRRSSLLSLEQKQSAYDEYFIRAPFAGVIAAVPVQTGDEISSGTTLATLISQKQIAEISLNEIDAAKVAVGQAVTLTFDAIDGLELTGKVLSIDLVGTVSQGVVSYNVKIGLDTTDPRVRPGMTTSAEIVVESKKDVLAVPSGAVKTDAMGTYVEVSAVGPVPATRSSASGTSATVALTTTPKKVRVKTGLTSDTKTEIISGLTGGETIVVRTITASGSATSQAPSATSLFGGGTRRTTGAGFSR